MNQVGSLNSPSLSSFSTNLDAKTCPPPAFVCTPRTMASSTVKSCKTVQDHTRWDRYHKNNAGRQRYRMNTGFFLQESKQRYAEQPPPHSMLCCSSELGPTLPLGPTQPPPSTTQPSPNPSPVPAHSPHAAPRYAAPRYAAHPSPPQPTSARSCTAWLNLFALTPLNTVARGGKQLHTNKNKEQQNVMGCKM